MAGPDDDRDDDRDLDEEEEEEVDEEERDVAAAEAAAAAAAAEEEEELEDEKPFDGEVAVPLNLPHLPASVTVRFTDGEQPLPQWLLYLANDDVYWFNRCVQGKVKPKPRDDAEVEEAPEDGAPGDGDDAAGGAPPAPADDAEEEEGDEPRLHVNVNEKFALCQTVAGGEIFVCKPYVPPAPEPEEAEADDEAAAADAAAADAADGGDADAEAEDEDGEEAVEAAVEEQHEEEEEPLLEVVVDALTLAALLSKRCLVLGLQQPNVSLAELFAFISTRFVSGNRHALDTVITALRDVPLPTPPAPPAPPAAEEGDAPPAEGDEEDAAAAAPPAPPPPTIEMRPIRRVVDFNWIINAHNAAPGDVPEIKDDTAAATVANAATSYMKVLLDLNVCPSVPIAATNLRTTRAVNGYLTLLLTMPKSILIAWSKPVAPSGEDEEAADVPTEVPEDVAEEAQTAINAPVPRFLCTALIDLRRRAVRMAKDKPPLRESVVDANKRTFAMLKLLGGGDKGADIVAAPAYGQRSYSPQHLQLRVSDLVVAAFARYDFAVDAFAAALEARMSVVRERDAPFGLPQLLFDTMATSMSPAALTTLVEAADPDWLEPRGLVDALPWATNALAANPMAMDAVAKRFAQRFGKHLIADQKYIHAVEDTSTALYNRLREVERFAESALREFKKTDPESCDTGALDTALERCGADLVCTSAMLQHAVAARNTVGVHWLVSRDVASVALPGTAQEVPVLEYVVLHQRDVDLTRFLVTLGADLSARWAGGKTSGTCAVQDTFADDDASDILTLYHDREAERLSDPRNLYGVLHAIAA